MVVGETWGGEIVYSLSTNKTYALNKVKGFFEQYGCYTSTTIKDKLVSLRISNKYAIALIQNYVSGTALNKQFNPIVFSMGKEFRQGLLDGLQYTDGTQYKNRSRVYTTSKILKEQIIYLSQSLGTIISTSMDTRTNKILPNNYLSNSVVYAVKPMTRKNYGNLYIDGGSVQWVKIVNKEVSKKEKNLYCFEVNSNTHLFQLANGLVTHNCRLQLDLRELKMRGNGLFGSAEQTGSVGVVTLNCARIGYLFRNKPFEDVKKHIQKLCDIAKDSLETKRVYLTKRLEEGLYPYTKRYLGTFRNHFSTIGVNGINEFILNYTDGKDDIVSNPYLATEILSVIREKMKVFQKETGNMYNLEATPAEGAMYRFAREDKKRYRDIIQAGTDDAPYYTNSSQLPTSFSNDIFAQLDHQEPLQTLYTGGTVLHLFLGEKIDSDKAKRIVKKVFQNYRVPYITLTPVYSICSKHGYISGKHSICPYCGEETEVYDRVMGYYKPIKSANIGKKQEIEERNRTILN